MNTIICIQPLIDCFSFFLHSFCPNLFYFFLFYLAFQCSGMHTHTHKHIHLTFKVKGMGLRENGGVRVCTLCYIIDAPYYLTS